MRISKKAQACKNRIECDLLGKITVPSDKYWGAQTERARKHFAIGEEKMPFMLIREIALIKKVAALTHGKLGLLSKQKVKSIMRAADCVIKGKICDQFPLMVWQSGSGTQTNMNVNEVIANLANSYLRSKKIHPNDDVNRSQSTNDVFPTAIHITVAEFLLRDLLPAVVDFRKTLYKKEREFSQFVKIGRTHLQDAVPMTLGQEFSAFSATIAHIERIIRQAVKSVLELPLGGTAVGTGLNASKNFARLAIAEIARIKKIPFRESKNRFALLASHTALLEISSALNLLAAELMKIANDIRWLSSGPRTGLQELMLPENEPGSSIMPGKNNPTQCEALLMVAARVIGNHTTMILAESHGNLQLNIFKPVMAYSLLQSLKLLADAMRSFSKYMLLPLRANAEKLKSNLDNSLMTVTALSPVLGYDRAAYLAKYASNNNLTLREACFALKFLDGTTFDRVINFKKMAQVIK